MASLLLLANPPLSVDLLADSVRQLGHSVTLAKIADEQSAMSFDALLLVLDQSTLQDIPRLLLAYPSKPIIVLSETGQQDLTLAALHAGAASFISLTNLPRDIGDALGELLHTSTSQVKRTIFLSRLTSLTYEYTLENDTEFIGLVITQAELMFQQFKLFDESVRMQIGVAIHEALVNAMIHGNLEVASSLKHDNWDEYHRQIAQRNQTKPYMDRKVRVRLQVEKNQYFLVVIRDEGPGFDVAALRDATDTDGYEKCSGRGLMLIRAFFDEVRHNTHGNEINMVKIVLDRTL